MELIRARLAATGPRGEPLSLVTGAETLEELRNMIVELTEACPPSLNHPHYPFRILSGLSYASLTNLVRNMPREACLNLFELELESRSRVEAPICGTLQPA